MILFTKPKASRGPGLPAHRQEPVVLRPQRGQVGAAHRARAHRRHQLAPLGLRRVAAGRGVRPGVRGRGEAGRLHRPGAEPEGQAGPGPGLPGDQAVGRQGHQERPQAAGVRAVGAAAAHVVLPEVEEALQRVEEGRHLVPAGDPLLRRGGEGQPDADPDQERRPQAAASRTSSPRPGWRASRDERASWRAVALALALAGLGLLAATGLGRSRPARTNRTSSASRRPSRSRPSAPEADQPTRSSRPRRARGAPRSEPPRQPPASGEAAAAAEPTRRSRGPARRSRRATTPSWACPRRRGSTADAAPEDPLQIGGMFYLRAQTTAREDESPDRLEHSARPAWSTPTWTPAPTSACAG